MTEHETLIARQAYRAKQLGRQYLLAPNNAPKRKTPMPNEASLWRNHLRLREAIK